MARCLRCGLAMLIHALKQLPRHASTVQELNIIRVTGTSPLGLQYFAHLMGRHSRIRSIGVPKLDSVPSQNQLV